MPNPEELARINIDKQLSACGWVIQDMSGLNRYAGLGVAVREFPLATGEADYLLFVDGKAVGVVEAKPEGTTLSGVAEQAGSYVVGLPQNIPHVTLPLPFQYESTGVETLFRDNRDPSPRSRRVFAFHRPETLNEWIINNGGTLRARLQYLPPLNNGKMWSAQIEAVTCLEQSLVQDKPRALIQMATGSGKTFTAINAIYRLIKFGKARRVLFLVDRANLAKQALKEFQAFETPDDGRKFTELYNVVRLETNAIDPVNKVVITTIQRLYSILSGEPEFDAQNEEGSLFEVGSALDKQPPKEVKYNPRIPIEFFDIIITDECHRSIYKLWRGVLEYFDAHLIGLTATPSKQTLGFFNQNLVMEYSRTRAVADGVNVDGEVYRIHTRIGDQGNTVEAGEWVGKRDKLRRAERMELLDQDFAYNAEQLDRTVVASNQIRTILQTFKDRLPADLFPGRTEVPKTLIFAKDDSHAEDIVHIAREVFGKGDEFCKKITYQVQNPEQLISDFRNAYFPRIAVTVDMIATGTDIKPVEILIFMRAVKSRILFEQMLGRATRVISQTDLRGVNPDPDIRKDHFVIVDAVGIVEQEKVETQSLERKKSVSFEKLMGMVAAGAVDEDVVSSLAGRLIRLKKDLSASELKEVNLLAGEGGLPAVIHVDDSLAADPGKRFNMVLTNPPFGKKSSVTFVTEKGEVKRESTTVVRDDFWASTSNKQLNFVQHVKTLLEINGRAAVVVPDNVLFEGGAGETVRRKLLHECDVHTLLRLPTGIFYAQGVKANVLFFDRKPASETPWTKQLWIYDLRTNKDFTLKTNPLAKEDLQEFIDCYNPENRNKRKATWSDENPDGRWRSFTYDELVARDKVNLDIFWLRDESLEDSANLPSPDVLALEIVEDLKAAMSQFESIEEELSADD